jgi:hypothetical protein
MFPKFGNKYLEKLLSKTQALCARMNGVACGLLALFVCGQPELGSCWAQFFVQFLIFDFFGFE